MQLSNKWWWITFGGLGVLIFSLLLAIGWKYYSTERNNETSGLVKSYYSAIIKKDSNRVQTAWKNQTDSQARYAFQTIQDLDDGLCLPVEIKEGKVMGLVYIIPVSLKCGANIVGVMFYLDTTETKWKIREIKLDETQRNLGDGVIALSQPVLASGGVTNSPFTPNPENTVYEYYEALNKQDCEMAKWLWPSTQSCSKEEELDDVKISTRKEIGGLALVKVNRKFYKSDTPYLHIGYIWLKRGETNYWKIQPESFTTEARANVFFEGKLATQLSSQLQNTIVNDSIVEGRTVDVTSFKTFGSQEILDSCWSTDTLKGSFLEKNIISYKNNPDYSPPVRQVPYHSPVPLPSRLQGSIRTVKIPNPEKKLVAITFDLCEHAGEKTGYDSLVVNHLRSNKVPATFYAGGKWMRSHPVKTKQLMADPLFEVGNHAWTHGNMRVLSGSEMRQQVLWTQAQYEVLWDSLAEELPQCGVPITEIEKIPPIPLSFRYPYGTCSSESLGFMEEYGLPSVQWNIVTADPWRKQTSDGIADTIIKNIKPGSIIIAHANGRGWKTGEALPKFIPRLRAMGYQFVTVSELLASGTEVEAKDTCYELKPDDNLFYDKKVGRGTE